MSDRPDTTRHLTLVVSAGLAMLLLSCSDLALDPVGTSGSTASALTSVTPAPEVVITSPLRASFQAPGRTSVEGRVSLAQASQAPIQMVFVNGQPVTLEFSSSH